jgi:hypothetical protein
MVSVSAATEEVRQMSRDQVRNELLERRVRRDARRRTAEHGPPSWVLDELLHAWRAAQNDATAAYERWREVTGADAYVAYRAAQDRADQAQNALGEQHAQSRLP